MKIAEHIGLTIAASLLVAISGCGGGTDEEPTPEPADVPDVTATPDPGGETPDIPTDEGSDPDTKDVSEPDTKDTKDPTGQEYAPIEPITSCFLDGAPGAIVECPVRLARQSQGIDPATRVEIQVAYDAGSATFLGLVDLICVGDNCLETLIDSAGSLSTGHALTMVPDNAAGWSGDGMLSLIHPTSNAEAITEAYLDETGALSGDSLVGVLRFRMTADPDEPEAISLSLGSAQSPTGESLPTAAQGDVLVTAAFGSDCGGVVCFDDNPCTDDVCSGGECTFTATDNPCDDGNPCTGSDACSEGVCTGDGASAEGEDCKGANLCTEIGVCDGAGECAYNAAKAVDCTGLAGDCADAACSGATGACVVTPKTGDCDDDNACTQNDACDATATCFGTPVTCDDGQGCTVDSCDTQTGCANVANDAVCDDDNPCTTDACTDEGCISTATDGPCDDGDSCTLNDVCTGVACVGSPDIANCGCAIDSDCAGQNDGDLCSGTFVCFAGACTLSPGSDVQCPPDGYQCKDSWTCDSASGQCASETISDCDDGLTCTVDSCSPSQGCKHETVSFCPLGDLCSISGSTGDFVTCGIRVAREELGQLPATGANTRFGWDSGKVKLANLIDQFCFGGTCYPFDALTCGADGTGCTGQPLQSGHSMIVVPAALADWTDWVSITLVHQASVDTPVSDAVLTPEGDAGDDALVVSLKFELLQDIPPDTPVVVEYTEASFDRVDTPLKASVSELPSGSAVVTGGAK